MVSIIQFRAGIFLSTLAHIDINGTCTHTVVSSSGGVDPVVVEVSLPCQCEYSKLIHPVYYLSFQILFSCIITKTYHSVGMEVKKVWCKHKYPVFYNGKIPEFE